MSRSMFFVLVLFGAVPVASGEWVNVKDHFPADWEEEGKDLDLHAYIQEAVEENEKVRFPGSDDPDAPLLYHSSAGIAVPSETRLKFEPHHRLVRLPSEGPLLSLGDRVHLSGVVIDGNKYAHWPEYQDLGKESEAAVRFRDYAVIEDSVVFNNPGHGFSSRGSYNRLYRCRAENIGYIDVRAGYKDRMHYSGRWDGWSGDGFYLRGSHNLVMDSEAYDAQRMGFVTAHTDGGGGNTYKNCRGGNVEFGTRGFLTFVNGGEPASHNRAIRCKSPNSRIHVRGERYPQIIDCIASTISVNDSHRPMVIDNITTGLRRPGGINVGMHREVGEQMCTSPIVIGNVQYNQSPEPHGFGDWSFTVHSADGVGLVAGNTLHEYEYDGARGPGQDFRGVVAEDNRIRYGPAKGLEEMMPEGRSLHEPQFKYASYEGREELEYDEEHVIEFD